MEQLKLKENQRQNVNKNPTPK